jgi:hypothetical protein
MSRKHVTCYRGHQAGSYAGDRQDSSGVFYQDSKNECQDIVEEPTTAHVKEETTHSLRARDVAALVTLGSFFWTDQKRRNGSMPVGYSGQAVLKREQCGMSAESRNSLL